MAAHAAILDERDSNRGAFVRSVLLHLALAGVIFAWTALKLGNRVERWGDPKALGGGSVAITPVGAIPMETRRGRVNPVANDTESQIPAAPVKPTPKQAPAPEPDAIALKSRNAKTKAGQQVTERYVPLAKPNPNQVFTRSGQALTSPMYARAPGGGGVGSGSGSPFGQRFGWYEQLLRERVAQNWRSQELDNRIRNRVAVTFEIARNGQVRNVRVSQSSGNFAMDQSAQRAILMSNPLPELPREYERDVALVEFWFALQH